jgi:hypothetical protein
MFRKLRQKMNRRVAPRKERAVAVRVRGVLERLEERSMLSAYGLMDYGHGGQVLGARKEAGPRFNDSTLAARQQQRSPTYDTQMFSNGPEFGGRHGGLQYRPPMQADFQYSYRPGPFEQHSFQMLSWNQQFERPPVTFVLFEERPYFESPIADNPGVLARVAQKSTPSVLPPNNIFDSLNAFNRSSDNHFQALPVTLDPVKNTIPPGISVLGIGPTLFDVPIASQILSRETSTVSALTAVSRELAFQEFSSTLFQSNATNSYDRANLNGLGIESTQPEMLDGFIRSTDGSMVDAPVNSSDAIVRELEAIDAVLDELHEPDKFLPAPISSNTNLQSDLRADAALNEMPAGEVDGGMVLLQSTGDANVSGLDLTPAYVDHFDRSDRPAKIETSVGMFQAVDVQSDDAPTNDTTPQMESTSALTPEIKLDENVSRQRESSSSNKAAALAGASTLTGALLWLSRSSHRPRRPEPTAQKRRASRR